MKILRQPDVSAVLIAAAAVTAVLVYVGGNGFRQDLAVLACTYSLIALGMYVPFVMAGSLSMAYSAYAGIGGYALGLVATETGWPLWVAWLLGALTSAAIAVLLGLATRRLSGFYLAAVTLLFGIAFEHWLIDADGITGGSSGIGGIRSLSIFGSSLSRSAQVTLAVIMVCVVALLLDRLRRSPFGVAVRGMREAPIAVEAVGIRRPTLELVALAIGAAIASFGGALFASFVGGITPETFTLNIVFLAIFMPLLGGTGTAWGAVVGALLVVELTLNFPAFAKSGTLVLSVGVLVVLLVAPKGLVGYANSGRLRLLSVVSRGQHT